MPVAIPAASPPEERARLDAALERARRALQAAHDAVALRAGARGAELLDAQLLSLSDEALLGPARAAIEQEGLAAAAAWQRSVRSVAAGYRALEDLYQQARAADVEDVGAQVLAALGGAAPERELPPSAPGILVADDLSLAEVARLDPGRVLGIATARGGPTSHAAILARTLGIPALAGAGEGILELSDGTPAALDGDAGRLLVHPPAALLAELALRGEAQRRALQEARAASAAPAVTQDGRRIQVLANVRSAAEARAAVAAGAEGVGVLRTELLFLDRRQAPDEEEQLAAYRAVAEAMEGRPVVIRTLDAGGDKPLPYLDMGGRPTRTWAGGRSASAWPSRSCSRPSSAPSCARRPTTRSR